MEDQFQILWMRILKLIRNTDYLVVVAEKKLINLLIT
jgi:hypothetical protein